MGLRKQAVFTKAICINFSEMFRIMLKYLSVANTILKNLENTECGSGALHYGLGSPIRPHCKVNGKSLVKTQVLLSESQPWGHVDQ